MMILFLFDFMGLTVSHVTDEESGAIRRGDEVADQGATLLMGSLLQPFKRYK